MFRLVSGRGVRFFVGSNNMLWKRKQVNGMVILLIIMGAFLLGFIALSINSTILEIAKLRYQSKGQCSTAPVLQPPTNNAQTVGDYTQPATYLHLMGKDGVEPKQS